MITRTLILFAIITACFGIAVNKGYLKYKQVPASYFIKAERYAYTDTPAINMIAMVGTSLSAQYKIEVQQPNTFINLSMTGKSPIDGINLIIASGKHPKILMVEANLFDNVIDSATLEKVFYPVMKDVKKNAIFLQREYKLHNLLPEIIYETNENVLGSIAHHTGLYSDAQKEISKANITWKEEHVRNYNIAYHSTLAYTETINNRYQLFEKELRYLKEKGVKVILFETPVVNPIYMSDRTAYKKRMLNEISKHLDLPYVTVADNNMYQPYLLKGDGIHLNSEGRLAYQTFLNDTISRLIKQ